VQNVLLEHFHKSCSDASRGPMDSYIFSVNALNHVREHRVAELGFKPGALGRHDAASVGDGHEVFDAGGEHREGAGVFTGVHEFLEFASAANAADEVDALARARVIDAEQRREDVFLQQRDVEFFDGVGGRGELRTEIKRVPLAFEEETEFVFASWLRRAVWLDDENGVEFLEQLSGSKSVEILQHAVVGENLHLVVRENDAQKIAAVTSAFAALIDATGGGAAVVSISDVKKWDGGEFVFDELDGGGIVDNPGGVAHAVLGSEIDVRLFSGFLFGQVIDYGIGAVSQKHRAGLRIERFDVSDAVVFLVGPGELMLLDDVLEIILTARGGDEADLAVFAHDLAIKIEGGLGILFERAVLDQLLEIFLTLRVNFRSVDISGGGEVDFRFGDVEKAEGIANRHLAGFRGRHDVIG
jgi:hypothetical protein